MFAGHGEFDNIVPVALGQRAVDTLKAHGQPVSWHTYPMMHAVCIEEIQAIGQWLRSVLKDQASLAQIEELLGVEPPVNE